MCSLSRSSVHWTAVQWQESADPTRSGGGQVPLHFIDPVPDGGQLRLQLHRLLVEFGCIYWQFILQCEEESIDSHMCVCVCVCVCECV